MKHYYHYIETGQVVDTTSRFFLVKIGTSKTETRLLQRLIGFAQANGHYFHRVDANSRDFVRRCLESVYGSSDPVTYAKHVHSCDARGLWKCVTEGIDAMRHDPSVENATHLMCLLDINFRVRLNAI